MIVKREHIIISFPHLFHADLEGEAVPAGEFRPKDVLLGEEVDQFEVVFSQVGDAAAGSLDLLRELVVELCAVPPLHRPLLLLTQTLELGKQFALAEPRSHYQLVLAVGPRPPQSLPQHQSCQFPQLVLPVEFVDDSECLGLL
jgi:hypothetical protein